MPSYRVETTIERSPEQVFAFITDPANTPRWAPAVLESRGEAPPRVGAAGIETRRFLGRRVTWRWEISEFKPGRSYGFRYPNGPVPLDTRFVLEPSGAGTRVACETDLHPRGIFRLLKGLVVREARKEDEGNLRRLKDALEETGP